MNSYNSSRTTPTRKAPNAPFLFFLIGMVVCLFLFFSPAQKLLIMPVIVLFVAVMIYFVYLVYVTARNSKAQKDIINSIPENERTAYTNHPATQFATSPQRYTKVFNIIFFISVAASLCTLFASSQTSESGVSFLGLRVILLLITLLAWLLSIIAGQPLIRDHDIRFTEQYAIQTKTGAWRKISHNQIITWSVWVIGTAILPVLAISIFVT
jgi:Ca2+/Na+ antiporter